KSKTENEDENQKSTIKKFSNGLSIADLNALEKLPYITNISPEIVLNSYALYKTTKREIKLIGTDNNYFTINSLKLLDGKIFNNTQLNLSHNVCIIGNSIKTKLFA